MALDIEKQISPFIERQFPEFYREEGDLFITFVKAYYEWLETQSFVDKNDNIITNDGPLYHSRRLTDYRDIDTTIDQFILSFKNKYLSNVQFNVASNKKLFIKNTLEFYRAKGTERAVDLFFKLIYGLEARVYYPADDLFKLSDNTFDKLRYVELEPNTRNIDFVGRQVFGASSGASGFGDRLVRIKKDNQYTEVLYIADQLGDFQTDEQLITIGDGAQVSSRIIGSLSSFTVQSSSANFEIGEVAYVDDGKGKKAKAVVTGTTDYVGIVEFELLEGGWGFSEDYEILASERVIEFNDLKIENDRLLYHTDQFDRFETLKQDLILVPLAANTDPEVYGLIDGTPVFATDDDTITGNVLFEGRIVDSDDDFNQMVINYTDSAYRDANNDLTIPLLGNTQLTFQKFFVESANLEIDVDLTDAFIVDKSASANIIATKDTYTIEYTGDRLSEGDIVYQKIPNVPDISFANAEVIEIENDFTAQRQFATLRKSSGMLRTNKLFYTQGKSNENTIVKISNTTAGIIGIGSEIPNNYFYNAANTYGANTGSYSNTIAIYSYDAQNPARFTVSEFSDTESFPDTYSPELIGPELDVVIGSTDFSNNLDYVVDNGPGSVEFSNTTLFDALGYAWSNTEPEGTPDPILYGSVKTIVVTNPGRGYAASPFYVIYEPRNYHSERYDIEIRYTLEEERKAFRVGEILRTQNATLGRPDRELYVRIVSHDPVAGKLVCTRLHLSSEYYTNAPQPVSRWTSDDFRHGDIVRGEDSNVTAFIAEVNELRMQPGVGINADVRSDAFSGTGFATDLRVIDSGFGYFGRRREDGQIKEGEYLTLISTKDGEKSISATGFLGINGIQEGTWLNRRSFLSSDKYLHDNDFYQEYSYQVLTALPFDKYKETLIELLHVAGTKPFGGYVGTVDSTIPINVEQSVGFYDIKQFPMFINENTFFPAGIYTEEQLFNLNLDVNLDFT